VRIGITGPPEHPDYARAVRDAGGEPSPLANDLASIDAVLAAFDGIVFSGGTDVEPTRYGRDNEDRTYDPSRDAFEIALARALRDRRLPTLGICRGAQLLNVAFGGKLIVDIPAALGLAPATHQSTHADTTNRAIAQAHIVTLTEGLLSEALTATTLPTTTRHHQSIDPAHLAPALHVVGGTPDGIIEAVEATFDHPWFAAVQWHPETSAIGENDPPSRALFTAFLKACQSRI